MESWPLAAHSRTEKSKKHQIIVDGFLFSQKWENVDLMRSCSQLSGFLKRPSQSGDVNGILAASYAFPNRKTNQSHVGYEGVPVILQAYYSIKEASAAVNEDIECSFAKEEKPRTLH
jgi:hypothetical protein